MMPEPQKPAVSPSIFNKAATEKLRSPDDLDKYVRVTNPSVWVMLIACIALVVGLLSWGVFGSVAETVSATGTFTNGKALCMLDADDVAKVRVGDDAFVGGQQMKIQEIDDIPLSREEASALLGSDYLTSSLMHGDWGYRVTFTGDTSQFAESRPLEVTISTSRIAPISLILGER